MYTLHSIVLEMEEMKDKLLLALNQMNNSLKVWNISDPMENVSAEMSHVLGSSSD